MNRACFYKKNTNLHEQNKRTSSIRPLKNNYVRMKKLTFIFALTIFILTTFSSCAVVGGIFKAGMSVGIFLVVIVVALILFFIFRMRKNK